MHRFIAGLFGYELINRRKSHERYFLHLTKVLERYRVQTLFDVGANVGQFAQALRRQGYRGRILSFEPQSGCYRQLATLAEADPLWEVFPFALGKADSEERIFVPQGSDFASFRPLNDYARQRFARQVAAVSEETVQVRDFQRWLGDNPQHLEGPSFLKLDTQGFDLTILEAAEPFLDRIAGISTELSFKALYDRMPSYLDVLQFMERQGFAVSNISPVSRDPRTFELIEADGVFLNSRIAAATAAE